MPTRTHKNAGAITIAGIQYNSINAAARTLGVSPGTVARNKDNSEYWQHLRPHPKPIPRPITINGIEYQTIGDAARAIGVARTTLAQHLDNPDDWLANRGRLPRTSGEAPRPVTIDGIEYPSVNAAARALGVSTGTIRYWIKRGRTMPVNWSRYPEG